MALDFAVQQDFAAGMFQAIARHEIPDNGAWDIVDALLDDDASVYERGGNEYIGINAFGEEPLQFIWDGYLTPGRRTLIASTAGYAVLDSDEEPIELGGTGLSRPKRAVELAGLLFIGGGDVYGGSLLGADYTTGTIAVTDTSKTVTGTGTAFMANVDAGMLLQIAGTGRIYPVAAVVSDTELTLRDPISGITSSGLGFTAKRIAHVADPYKESDLYFVAANRLFVLSGNRIDFSERNAPGDYTNPVPTANFHEIPLGATLLGGAGIRDDALLFASNGLWQLTGLPFDIVDAEGNAQHRLEHVSEDLVLLNHEGIASWAGRLIVPCTDAIWMLDGVSSPVRISDSIAARWRKRVSEGCRAGSPAVIRSHLFLPVLNTQGNVEDMLVCRLDRAVDTRLGQIRPFTRIRGFASDTPALAVRPGDAEFSRNPILLQAGNDGRVCTGNSMFGQSSDSATDADGTYPELEIVTRDVPVKDGFGTGTVRRLTARYELAGTPEGTFYFPPGVVVWDSATWDSSLWDDFPEGVFTPLESDPTIRLAYSAGKGLAPDADLWDLASWNEAVWSGDEAVEWTDVAGEAPEDDGLEPYTWHLTVRARFIRFRLRMSDPARKMVLRSLQMFSRASNKDK